MSKNDISMAYRIDKLPEPLQKRRVLETLIESVSTGELPAGWAVTWLWRNTAKQDMREAPFEIAVAQSRAGFHKLMLGRLRRDLDRLLGITDDVPPPPPVSPPSGDLPFGPSPGGDAKRKKRKTPKRARASKRTATKGAKSKRR